MSASVLEKSIYGPAAWNQGIEKSRVPSLVGLHDTNSNHRKGVSQDFYDRNQGQQGFMVVGTALRDWYL